MGKKLRCFLFILVFPLLFFSCDEKQQKGDVVEINLRDEGIDAPCFENIVSDMQFIPLETSDSVLIQSYDKIYLDKNYVYILDNTQRTLFKFQLDGSFHSKICKIGRAAEEYIGTDDFVVDDNGNISIYDGGIGCLYEYSSCGSFVKKINLSRGKQLLKLGQGFWVYTGVLEDKGLYAIDKRGSVTDSYFSNENLPRYNIASNGSITLLGESVICAPAFSNTVYRVQGEKCVPCFTFDFLSDNLSENLRNEKDFRRFYKKMLDFNGVIGLSNLYAHDNWIIFYAGKTIFFDAEKKKPFVLSHLKSPFFPLTGCIWSGNDEGMIYTHVKISNLVNGLLPVLDNYVDKYPFLQILQKYPFNENNNDWIFVCKLKNL